MNCPANREGREKERPFTGHTHSLDSLEIHQRKPCSLEIKDKYQNGVVTQKQRGGPQEGREGDVEGDNGQEMGLGSWSWGSVEKVLA